MSEKILFALCLFIIGHALIWYCHNSQFVWEWWEGKWFLSAFLVGVPASISFWYGTKIMMEEVDSLWTMRFTAFALSYVTFPILTWYHLGENPFTVKTVICTLLAIVILLVQVGFK